MAAAILITGLIAGVLDGIAAVALYMYRGGRAPARVFNFIATGVFGPSAMTGGTSMVIAGVVLHLLIAIGWTLLFFMAARQFEVLRRHFIGAAVVYGAFVWIMMNKVILPLSRVQMGPGGTWDQIAIGVLIIIVCVGFPVAIGARQYFSQPAAL
jgi:hypothetical protein